MATKEQVIELMNNIYNEVDEVDEAIKQLNVLRIELNDLQAELLDTPDQIENSIEEQD